MRMGHKALIATVFAGIVFLAAVPGEADEIYEAKKWTVGTHAGIQMKTVSGNVFTMAANVDYRLSPQFSAGPMAFASSGVDLTEYAIALTGRYHQPMGSWNLIPFAGIGMISGDYLESKSSGLYVPLGVTAEFHWKGNVFTGTAMLNFHQFNYDVHPQKDPKSLSLMLGVRL